MSGRTLKILDEWRALPLEERREVAAVIVSEAGSVTRTGRPEERLRLLDEVTAKYTADGPPPDNLQDAWADAILAGKRTA